MNAQEALTRPQCDNCQHVMVLTAIERWRDDGHPRSKLRWRCRYCDQTKCERM